MSDAPARPPVVRYEVTGRVGVIDRTECFSSLDDPAPEG